MEYLLERKLIKIKNNFKFFFVRIDLIIFFSKNKYNEVFEKKLILQFL